LCVFSRTHVEHYKVQIKKLVIEHRLKKIFDKFYEAPIEAWRSFVDLCERVEFKKNEKIKDAGKRHAFGYFLIEGTVGLFVVKENKRVCLDFIIEDNFFADDLALSTGEPSPIEIVALEKSLVLRMSKSNIDLLKQTPIGKILFSVGDEQALLDKQKQQIDLMTKSVEERYIEILNYRPELIERISQKDIASYLGISTQSLSRIRRRIK